MDETELMDRLEAEIARRVAAEIARNHAVKVRDNLREDIKALQKQIETLQAERSALYAKLEYAKLEGVEVEVHFLKTEGPTAGGAT